MTKQKKRNDELKRKNDELKNKNDELKDQLEEYNATISEVEKYLDNSYVTNSSIIKSTINEHYYLSKPPVVYFDNILCKVHIIENNDSDLYDTAFEWKYEGSREPSGTDFLVDVFSTTEIDDDFEKSLSIRCRSDRSWRDLKKGKEYDVTNKGDANHRTIKFDMSKIATNNFEILLRYTLKKNYNFKISQETFVFMPFIYSNARNNKFKCKINFGNYYNNVEKAVIIKSSKDEYLYLTNDTNGDKIFEFNSEYTSAKDFKNVTLNIIHNT